MQVVYLEWFAENRWERMVIIHPADNIGTLPAYEARTVTLREKETGQGFRGSYLRLPIVGVGPIIVGFPPHQGNGPAQGSSANLSRSEGQ